MAVDADGCSVPTRKHTCRHIHTHAQVHTHAHTYKSVHTCPLFWSSMIYFSLFVMKITGRTGHCGEQTTLIQCVGVFGSPSWIFSFKSELCFWGTWAGIEQQYSVTTNNVITPQPIENHRQEYKLNSSLFFTYFIGLNSLKELSIVGRSWTTNNSARLSAIIFNEIFNIVKWEWTLKSRLSDVDTDYVEITFHRQALDNVRRKKKKKHKLDWPFLWVCWMKRLAYVRVAIIGNYIRVA